jgi:polyphosphate kinase
LLKARLEEILRVDLDDDVLAWELGHDGWAKIPTKKGISAHLTLQKIAKGRNGYSSSSSAS